MPGFDAGCTATAGGIEAGGAVWTMITAGAESAVSGAAAGGGTLGFVKDGTGRLYYGARLRYGQKRYAEALADAEALLKRPDAGERAVAARLLKALSLELLPGNELHAFSFEWPGRREVTIVQREGSQAQIVLPTFETYCALEIT
jgi:hypothetical protein